MYLKLTTIIAFTILFITSCIGQTHKKMKKQNNLNCDLETGICEVKTANIAEENTLTSNQNQTKSIKIIYYTDPICSACWGIEGQLRLLKLQYGDQLEIEYRMGGLLPGWKNYNGGGIQSPNDVAIHWEEASQHYEMPIDGDVWKENPLSSSYPPSIAFKAAELEDKDKAQLFLRRIKEMVFMEKEDISSWEVLKKAAKQVGLNEIQLIENSNGIAQQLFEEDLKMAAQLGVRGFPTLIFQNTENETLRLYGVKPYAAFESIVNTLNDQSEKKYKSVNSEIILTHFKTFTTKEYSILRSISTKDAINELKQLLTARKIKEQASKNGPLWIAR